MSDDQSRSESTDPEADIERSVTQWIGDLKRGEDDAAGNLWGRFFDQLVNVARRRMGSAPRREIDEEDLALSAFDSLCRGAAEGRFNELTNREDLWRLLVAIVRRKAVDQIRRQTSQKRGGGLVRGESVMPEDRAGIDEFLGSSPTPENLAAMEEESQRLLGLLRDDTQRQVALLRLEGLSNEEIAQRVGISIRSVERKLSLIRSTWACELNE